MPEKKLRYQKKITEIYIGPVIPGIVVPGMVFNNGLPPQLVAEIKKIPAIKLLLVDITKVIQAKKDLNCDGSAISICYKKVADYSAKKEVIK